MSVLYAVEAWILAILGWAWLTLRDLIPQRPLVEELSIYGTLFASTVNMLLCGLLRDRAEPLKAYLGFTLVIWTYLAYALLDCLDVYNTGARYVPDVDNSTVLCCPNRDVPEMNKAFYFGGLQLFLIPGAITFAFQTIQVLVAGAGYVSLKESIWPGNGWGYSLAALLSTAYFVRFSGMIEPPCPGGGFNTFFGLGLNYGEVFGFFAFGLMLLILLDGMALPPFLSFITRLFGLTIVSLFCMSVAYASDGRGMLTLGIILLLIKAWLPVVWSTIEPWLFPDINMPSTEIPVQPDLGRGRGSRRNVRWVVPISTNLSKPDNTLPSPLVMLDPPLDTDSAKDRKKRM